MVQVMWLRMKYHGRLKLLKFLRYVEKIFVQTYYFYIAENFQFLSQLHCPTDEDIDASFLLTSGH